MLIVAVMAGKREEFVGALEIVHSAGLAPLNCQSQQLRRLQVRRIRYRKRQELLDFVAVAPNDRAKLVGLPKVVRSPRLAGFQSHLLQLLHGVGQRAHLLGLGLLGGFAVLTAEHAAPARLEARG